MRRGRARRGLRRRFPRRRRGRACRFHTIGVSQRIIDRAAELVSRHDLRAYDAVQLATALTARTFETGISSACFDSTLCDAASTEGLPLIPAAEEAGKPDAAAPENDGR
jgi:predicted nucleic acid-binding protein